jgi:hypothetical protein
MGSNVEVPESARLVVYMRNADVQNKAWSESFVDHEYYLLFGPLFFEAFGHCVNLQALPLGCRFK